MRNILKVLIFSIAVVYCSASEGIMLNYTQYVAVEAAIAAIKKTEQYQKRKWSFGAYDIKVEPSSDGYWIWFTAPRMEPDSVSPQKRVMRFGSSYNDKYPSLVVSYDMKKAMVTSVHLQK
jgi:hypothetical protein